MKSLGDPDNALLSDPGHCRLCYLNRRPSLRDVGRKGEVSRSGRNRERRQNAGAVRRRERHWRGRDRGSGAHDLEAKQRECRGCLHDSRPAYDKAPSPGGLKIRSRQG